MNQFIIEASIALIALASLFVAAASLVATVWEGYENRKHNRLSVRPYLCFYIGRFPSSDEGHGFTLRNNGTGPAIVTAFEIFVDCMPVEGTGYERWGRVLELIRLEVSWLHCGYPGARTSLAPGESMSLLTCEPGSDFEAHASALRQVQHRLQMSVNYESIYGEKFSESTGVPPKLPLA